jgi:hypothetical protein
VLEASPTAQPMSEKTGQKNPPVAAQMVTNAPLMTT